MYILAVNGSPKKDGNTAFLLNKVLEHCEGADTEIIHAGEAVSSSKTAFCTDCSKPCSRACFRGTCLEECFDKLRRADAVLLGSPVYFGTVSGQIKAFWDKTRTLRQEGALIGKPCGAVACGHAVFGGQETTLRALQDMAMVQGMTVIGDGAGRDAGHQGVCGSGNVSAHEFANVRAKVMAARLMEAAN